MCLVTTPSVAWPRRRPTSERREVATHLIDNGGDLESLSRQVDEVWADLLTREPPEVPEAPPTEPE